MRRREFLGLVSVAAAAPVAATPKRKTAIAIRGDAFFINGRPTYEGRYFQGKKIEGLLLNSRMVQALFDDENPDTAVRWAYPDTKKWNAERNVSEFCAAMPEWRRYGLLSFTVNLQCGMPIPHQKEQPWSTSGIRADGSFKPEYLDRLERILDRAGSLGMAPIVGVFYFGQDERVKDEAAVKRAVENAVQWLLGKDYTNVLLEINNECNAPAYDHDILKPRRVHELIEMVKRIRLGGRRLLVGTSYGGNFIPTENVVRASDFLLMHGNGVKYPEALAQHVSQARAVPGYRSMPILFNEDPNFNFDQPNNHMMAAISSYASWGYYDAGKNDYVNGYQGPPVNWGVNTNNKRAFFRLVKEVTGE